MSLDRLEKLLLGGRKKAQILAEFLGEDIRSGVFKKGQKLPSYDDLGELYSINRLTVRKAIKILEERDVVHSISAKGTYAGSAPKSKLQRPLLGKPLVGLVSEIVDFESLGYHHMELISSMGKECGLHGYQMHFVHLNDNGEMDMKALNGIDGVVAIGPVSGENSRVLSSLASFVHIDPQKSSSAISVSADYCQGGRLAGEHFLELGHQNCAVIHGDQPCCEMIFSGFEEAVLSGNMKITSYHGNYTAPSAYDCVEKLLKEHPEVTAIFCMNDEMAAGAIQCLSRYDKKIPDDMSVLGFDNSAISTLLDPPLQTIGISSQHMAKMAMDILAAKIDHVDTYLSSSLIFPQMVERSSTGVPKK